MGKRLHIGCGKTLLPGWTNLDVYPHKGVDVVWNLNKFPYPFKDNTFNEVRAYQTMEHIKDLNGTLKELHRICKDKATIDIEVPYFRSIDAFAVTHHLFYSYKTFDAYTGQRVISSPLYTRLVKYKKKELRFRKAYRILGIALFAKHFPFFYEEFLGHIFPATDLKVILQIKKDKTKESEWYKI
jgi:hypothetical protein